MYRNDENPLDALKSLNHKKTEPVKRIGPKSNAALEGETSPKTITERLIGIAKDNDFNGVGKLTLFQARFELSDNSLQLKDLIELLSQYAPEVTVESRPGNLLLLHFPKVKQRKVVSALPELPSVKEQAPP